MTCFSCDKPVLDNLPKMCCLNCDFIHTMRNQALDEIFYYTEEEYALKQRIKELRKKRKEAEKRYEQMWRELGL